MRIYTLAMFALILIYSFIQYPLHIKLPIHCLSFIGDICFCLVLIDKRILYCTIQKSVDIH